MNKGITKENMMFTLPPALRGDESTEALAEATAEVLADRLAEIDRLRIVSNIDNLEEALLTILARDFKVDWWDPGYSLEEKRRTLKGSWRVHKILGTKAAVEMAIRAIYPRAWAEPWFAYEDGDGTPYHFRLHIDLSGEMLAEGKPARVLERVRYYQSLRDHLDELRYTIRAPEPARLHAGGGAGADSTLGQGEQEDVFAFTDEMHAGGAFGAVGNLPQPENLGQPGCASFLRFGGVCTIISNLFEGE